MRKILFCNVAWMDHYDGTDTKFTNGGEWVKLNNSACEYKNFYKFEDGYLRGYVKPTNFTIRPENFGEKKDKHFVEDVLVVWVSTPPKEIGRRVIGWYSNATVYKKPQEDNYHHYFFIKAKTEDSVLLRVRDRYKSIYMPRPSNTTECGMGRSNTWFAKGEKNKYILEEVLKFIDYYQEYQRIEPNRKKLFYKKDIISKKKSKCVNCNDNKDGWCVKYRGWCSRVKRDCK